MWRSGSVSVLGTECHVFESHHPEYYFSKIREKKFYYNKIKIRTFYNNFKFF